MRKGRGTGQSKGIEAFASLASTYEMWFASPLGMFVDQQEMQAFAWILTGFRPGSILEIGAGTGHIARFLARYGYQVTAIEPSPAMRAEGVQRTEGFPISWHDAQAEDLPFPANRFESNDPSGTSSSSSTVRM
jgi:ubiquinone/menaquinone biosynthesis C-methylase UbiE